MALSRHLMLSDPRPLSDEKATSQFRAGMSGDDPQPTFGSQVSRAAFGLGMSRGFGRGARSLFPRRTGVLRESLGVLSCELREAEHLGGPVHTAFSPAVFVFAALVRGLIVALLRFVQPCQKIALAPFKHGAAEPGIAVGADRAGAEQFKRSRTVGAGARHDPRCDRSRQRREGGRTVTLPSPALV